MNSTQPEPLSRELALRAGEVPAALVDAISRAPTFEIAPDEFLLRLPNGLRFHYQRGEGVAIARPDDVTDAEVLLFLYGSVYGAIAWLNGFVPLHASAVVWNGGVHAISGHSGAGKSTLAAALSQRGLPLFADDVLVLDLSRPDQIQCLPGHKQLKLWADALVLTGLAGGSRVRAALDKYYVAAPELSDAGPLPLSSLCFLDARAKTQPSLRAVPSTERFKAMPSVLYRPRFCRALMARRDLFALFGRLARVPAWRFDRPKRNEDFAAGADFLAAALRSDG